MRLVGRVLVFVGARSMPGPPLLYADVGPWDSYDKLFNPGAYLYSHAEHLSRWHGMEG